MTMTRWRHTVGRDMRHPAHDDTGSLKWPAMRHLYHLQSTRIGSIPRVLALVVYLALQLMLAAYHEPWRDEAQAWLIARDASPWQLVSDISRQEGHPPLWLLLLMPFAKLGAPYWTMQLLSIAVMTVAAALLLSCRAPAVFRYGVLFTAMFLYWQPVVSRSYCLVALVACLLAVLWPKRMIHPRWFALAIALLFQTHVLAFGFAGALTMSFGFEIFRVRKRFLPVLLLPILSALLTFLLLLGGGGSGVPGPSGDMEERLLSLVSGVFPVSGFLGMEHRVVVLALVALLVAAMLVALLAVDMKVAFVEASHVAWLLLVHMLVYPLSSMQKVASWLTLFVLAVPFIYGESSARPRHAVQGKSLILLDRLRMWRRIALASSMALALSTIPPTLVYAAWDVHEPFSAGQALAGFIEQESAGNDVIVPIDDRGSQYAVINALPYLRQGQRMWSDANAGFMTYATGRARDVWDRVPTVANDDAPVLAAEHIKDNHLAEQSRVIVVACTDSGDITLEQAFQKEGTFKWLAAMDEPNVPESLRSYNGIRCTIYGYIE